MNKSFLLSGGRKNDRFESGFKPATLPDLQNGNVSMPKSAQKVVPNNSQSDKFKVLCVFKLFGVFFSTLFGVVSVR
jgi:hypothetical protein